MDDHPSPNYRFNAWDIPRKVAGDLSAFRLYNGLENRRILEFARDIAIDPCDLAIANRVFAGTLRKSDSDDAADVRPGVAIA